MRKTVLVGMAVLWLIFGAQVGIAVEDPEAPNKPPTDTEQRLAAEIQQLKQRLTELEEAMRRLQETREKEESREATAVAETPPAEDDELAELRRLAEAEAMKE